jgi:excisionase family DNA binding protein
MAHYQARGQLYFMDTRDEAGEAAVQRWSSLTEHHDIRQVALIADASNKEIDRLNARAQHLRAERGELGPHEVPLPHQHYGLREGDLVAFAAQHRPSGQPRVENGARGQVTHISEHGGLTITLDGSDRQVRLAGEDLESLRLGYAKHVYRQQGATVERSVIVTGGWQTSKETAYVEASRARQGTEWFLARDELGAEGQDERRVMRLAGRMRQSRAQTPSLAHPELPDPRWGRDSTSGGCDRQASCAGSPVPLAISIAHPSVARLAVDGDQLVGRLARVAVHNRDSTKPRASEGNRMTPITQSTNEPPVPDQSSARLQDPLLRPEEAARLLSVRTSWTYEAVRARRLPCVRVGRHIRFTQRMLEEWLADNTHA